MVSKFGRYDYEAIKWNCLEKKQYFTDHEFIELFSPDKLEIKERVIWKRPKEIEDTPQFTIDGATRGDIRQGGLGDCWALSAMASLAGRPDLLKIVIPDINRQVLYGQKYCGILRFRFYYLGCWTEIIIDDFLPFNKAEELIFARNPDKNVRKSEGPREWWLPLLEKAYAKLEGGYENLNGGFTAVSLTALTGGFCEEVLLEEARKNVAKRFEILNMMRRTVDAGGLMCLETEHRKYKNGIVAGHAYSVTKVINVKDLRTLVRIRNPWGKTEWTGNVLSKYSDWKQAPRTLWKEIGYQNGMDAKNDGEFVMSIEDMVREFKKITLCTQRQSLLDAGWIIKQYRSMWVAGSTDGGNMDNQSFPSNPQMSFTIHTISKIRIDLEQKVKNKLSHRIGLYLFKDKGHKKKNGKIHKFACQPTIKSNYFHKFRSVNITGTLQKGEYVIVPCTEFPYIQAKFLLTISVQQYKV